MYNKERIRKVITISAICTGSALNILVSSIKAFGLIFGPAKLTITIAKAENANDHPIVIRKGIS